MKRKWLVNGIAATLVLFLSLPLFFEGDERPVALNLEDYEKKGSPMPLNSDAVAEGLLPVLKDGNAELPKESKSFLSNYISRVNSFYKKGFNTMTGISADVYKSGDDDMLYTGVPRGARASYGGFGNEAVVAQTAYGSTDSGDFIDNYYGAAVSSFSKGAGAGVKQKASEASVKGLYETSLTDKDKVEAKNIYKGVMLKVDRSVPGVQPKKTARAYAPSKAVSVPAGETGTGVLYSSASHAASDSAGNDYLGMAGRQHSSAQQGSYSGFGSSSVRASGSDSAGFEVGAFEAAAQTMVANIKEATGRSSAGGVNAGGSSAAAGSQQQGGANSAQNGNTGSAQQGSGSNNNSAGQDSGTTPGSSQNGGQNNGENPGQNQGDNQNPNPNPNPGDNGAHNHGDTMPVFNQDAWTAQDDEKASCDTNSSTPTADKDTAKPAGLFNFTDVASGAQKDAKPGEEEKNPTAPAGFAPEDKIDTCDSALDKKIQEFHPDVIKRFEKVLVVLGKADESSDWYVVPADFSIYVHALAGTGYTYSGIISKKYNGKPLPEGKVSNVSYMSRAEYEALEKDPKVLKLKVGDAPARNTINIQPGSVEYISGINQIVAEGNSRFAPPTEEDKNKIKQKKGKETSDALKLPA